jgi:alginate O-acetyltransferase complex protein AlgI
MLFSSYVFLFYFLPACLFSYYLTPAKLKNSVLLLFSLFFYAWGCPNVVPLLVLSCYLDYKVAKGWESRLKKQLLFLGLFVNIVSLLYFKYCNFFVQELNSWIQVLGFSPWAVSKIILPVGISFFTFHKISYLLDSYKNPENVAKSFPNYLLYITFFVQLIAGPIIKYHDISKQILERDHTYEKMYAGIIRFSFGLFKKVVIADGLAPVADFAFGQNAQTLDLTVAWVGVVAYSMQLYFDFSGYSDMAVGLSLFFGFRIPENFNKPYISKSISEFWTRWHISLGCWMREYLYIPLGGNRGSKFRNYLNLWIVFLFSGIWHGDNLTFVCWGLLHGFFITLDKLFYLDLIKKSKAGFLFVSINYFLLLLSWVFFRSETLEQSVHYIGALFGSSQASIVYYRSQLITDSSFFTLVAALIIAFSPLKLVDMLSAKQERVCSNVIPYTLGWASLALFCLSVSRLTSASFVPFLYFKF